MIHFNNSTSAAKNQGGKIPLGAVDVERRNDNGLEKHKINL